MTEKEPKQETKKVLSLGASKPTLELKKPLGGEAKAAGATGSVRQSFSHGRSKTVAVEVKRKRFESSAAANVEVKAGMTAARAGDLGGRLGTAPGGRQLTQEERESRMRALRGAVIESEQKKKAAEIEAQQIEDQAPEPEAVPEGPPMSAKERLRQRELEELRLIQDQERQDSERRKVEDEQRAKTLAASNAGRRGEASGDRAGRTLSARGADLASVQGAGVAVRRPATSGDEESDDSNRRGGRGGRGAVQPRRSSSTDRRRGGKMTVSQVLEGEEGGRHRSVASMRRRQERERRQAMQQQEQVKQVRDVIIPEVITVQELANRMAERAADVIKSLMKMGVMATITQSIDADTAELVATEFGHRIKRVAESDVEANLSLIEDTEINMLARPPVVTVMGHVDHGKTSLLDALRSTNVVSGEAGGITQHIGAYEVKTAVGNVTFLDTPGHEAFSAMRARGAKVTDIVVLVVAADSNVMPQTKEAIDHVRAAGVPMVVAINKIDLPTANPDNVRAQLAAYGVEVEQWGGKTQCVEISAKKGLNIDKLLDALLLESEVLGLRANPTSRAKGTVIECRLDKGKGAVATMLVQEGTLRVGDSILVGSYAGRIRQLLDERGQPRNEAGPSCPVQVIGIDGVPQAGDSFVQMDDDREAREIASRRLRAQKERELRRAQRMSLEDLSNKIAAGEEQQTLRVIVKGDVDGSVEAIAASLEQLTTKEVRVQILSRAVGGIKEADVMLAAASDAIIVAFHVRPDSNTRELALREGVEIRSYRIIYEVVDDIRKAMEGMLKPEIKEEVAAEAEVRAVFHVPKIGAVAGCYVQSGTIERKLKARVYRNGIEMAESRVSTLKRFKDDVHEVKSGFECGIGLDGVDDIQEGDIIAFFRQFEVARKLTEAVGNRG